MHDTLHPEMVTCDTCKKEYAIGEWPFCPHGKPQGMFAYTPYWDDNLGPEPVYITSLAQKRKIMKERGLEYRSPKVGRKGCEV